MSSSLEALESAVAATVKTLIAMILSATLESTASQVEERGPQPSFRMIDQRSF